MDYASIFHFLGRLGARNASSYAIAIATWYDDGQGPPPSEAECAAAWDALTHQQALDALRTERNRRLAACDYRMLPDYPMAESEALAWQAYRQALRDLPATISNLQTPLWPTPPA